MEKQLLKHYLLYLTSVWPNFLPVLSMWSRNSQILERALKVTPSCQGFASIHSKACLLDAISRQVTGFFVNCTFVSMEPGTLLPRVATAVLFNFPEATRRYLDWHQLDASAAAVTDAPILPSRICLIQSGAGNIFNSRVKKERVSFSMRLFILIDQLCYLAP